MPGDEDAEAEHAGPYRLLELLGEGGMGVVRRAVGEDGREVALKLLRPELAGETDFRRRLAREVDTMRRVRGPNIAEILDADVAGERPYIVTRFIRGRPLDVVVRAEGPLGGEELRRLAGGLADALVAIHGAGVVHRDLKPTNVMIADGVPVVIDFGIAHAVNATRLTRKGRVVGTPGYIGPEIIEGAEPGPALDVYGWAATVMFAATGRSPFGSGPLETVMRRVLTGGPDLTGAPPDLEPLLRAALDRDPSRRPPAAELATRIREPAPAPPARRVPLGAYRLLAYLLISCGAALCAVLPFLGCLGVTGAAWYLRAGDAAVRGRSVTVRRARDLVLAPARAKRGRIRANLLLPPTFAYAALVAGAVGVVLLARNRHHPIGADAITGWTAVAYGYVTLAGPWVRAPRRQLVRLLSGLAPGRRTVAGTGLVIAVGTAVAVWAAWALAPEWYPLITPYRNLRWLADTLRYRN